MTQPQALGTLLAQTNPKHLNRGTKSLQAQSCIWPEFRIRPLTHDLGAAVQQNNLLLQAATMPNLQQPAPSQPSKPNSPSTTMGCRPGTARHPAQAALGQGTGGPAPWSLSHGYLRAGGPCSHWRQWQGTPSFPLHLMPGLVLLLRANAGLFSGCPVLAKPTVKVSVGNH